MLRATLPRRNCPDRAKRVSAYASSLNRKMVVSIRFGALQALALQRLEFEGRLARTIPPLRYIWCVRLKQQITPLKRRGCRRAGEYTSITDAFFLLTQPGKQCARCAGQNCDALKLAPALQKALGTLFAFVARPSISEPAARILLFFDLPGAILSRSGQKKTIVTEVLALKLRF